MTPKRIYLDNAATSWPKPDAVYDAVDQYQRENGAPAGRGGYAQAVDVARLLDRTRAAAARLIGAEQDGRVVFTFNGTDSLNIALFGCLKPGDHVITTVVEHNSVLRPVRHLQQQGVEATIVSCDSVGRIDVDQVREAIRPDTAMIAAIHASNVTGAIQPCRELGAIAREHELLFLVDAAQSLGHLPLDAGQLHADLVAAPGHKGLLGPLGTGLLYVGPRAAGRIAPLRYGGTGTQSDDDRQPDTLPEKLEAGNHNVAGLVGLAAGVAYLEQYRFQGRQGISAIREHEQSLTRRLTAGLQSIPGVTLYGPSDASQRVGVVAWNITGCDPREAATMLESAFGIQCRAGFHCAPRMHRAMETDKLGGCLRFSVGPFNTPDQIDLAVDAVSQLAATADFTC